jgi:UDP-3-O-[3-hydroxymyristoyl] glucosamine N-acyltransferase
LRLSEIADYLGGEFVGCGDLEIRGIALPDEAGPSDIVYIEKQKYLEGASNSRAGAFLIDKRFSLNRSRPFIATASPRIAFIKLLQLFQPRNVHAPGIHPTVIVGSECRIDSSATIMAGCVLGDRVVIEQSAVIHPLCFLGSGVKIGAGSVLHPNVVVEHDCQVGKRCVLKPGVVLGADGFGYHDEGATRYRIPHLGRAVLGDGVELGANTTVDRAILGATYVGDETKVDNLVQIGHNCSIGSKCYLVAQSGVGGSTVVGSGVTLAGQSGVSDHLRIGDGAIVIGKSAVRQSLEPGEIVGGVPALPIRLENEISRLLPQLPELVHRVERLEQSRSRTETAVERRNVSWRQKVRDMLAENLRVKSEVIDEGMDLKEEFNADSLTVLNFLTEIESEFNISVPDHDVRGLKTLGDILHYLEKRLAEKEE